VLARCAGWCGRRRAAWLVVHCDRRAQGCGRLLCYAAGLSGAAAGRQHAEKLPMQCCRCLAVGAGWGGGLECWACSCHSGRQGCPALASSYDTLVPHRRYNDMIMARLFAHEDILELAQYRWAVRVSFLLRIVQVHRIGGTEPIGAGCCGPAHERSAAVCSSCRAAATLCPFFPPLQRLPSHQRPHRLQPPLPGELSADDCCLTTRMVVVAGGCCGGDRGPGCRQGGEATRPPLQPCVAGWPTAVQPSRLWLLACA
jgi:hypothetical protein